ncbi:carboxypeptidase-like regulatory domain-containing protein [Paraflavitalea speifideaquila]|uniref:carboxypeptidase-like regulatory domain-containing protein n=1 Tax=Paraflavitalea speifideaquila TaxID=3076558 RepID=UPI0028E6567E|nr:carboxypeptidase-like regulatory domain-containing protein [Paraflavitalea speifideiaquila]
MRQFRHLLFAGRRIWLLAFFMTYHLITMGQSKTVSGTILSADGLPLAGVSILIKGTTQGTSSDAEGKFVLPITTSRTILTVSMTGYSPQTMTANAGEHLKLTLEKTLKDLDEVVVVAYGRQKKAMW